MAHIEVSQHLNVDRATAWERLSDLSSHVEWMRDARSIRFLGDSRSGVGTRMEVETVVGPFRTTDVMEVVGWVEGQSIDVVHEGLVTGTGRLSLEPDGSRSVLRWVEDLSFPWWIGGPITAWLARPVLARIWRANLRGFAGSFNSR